MSKVSVIVATYRREQELNRALNSLSTQNYRNFEVIVVDDNDEHTWNNKVQNIVDEYRAKLSDIEIKYIENHPNLGSAKTRNKGIEAASGDYICFLDDDDEYLPDRIYNQISVMDETNADYSLTDLALYTDKKKLIEIRRRNYIESRSSNNLLKYHLMYHMTGTDVMMFKRDYLNQIGGFDPIDVGDEFYLMLKAIENAGEFIYVPVCDVRAYVHTGEMGLSSGESKINGENLLYKYKQSFFSKLDKKTVKYINMRHFAVLAFAYLKKGEYCNLVKNAIKSFVASPSDCLFFLHKLIMK